MRSGTSRGSRAPAASIAFDHDPNRRLTRSARGQVPSLERSASSGLPRAVASHGSQSSRRGGRPWIAVQRRMASRISARSSLARYARWPGRRGSRPAASTAALRPPNSRRTSLVVGQPGWRTRQSSQRGGSSWRSFQRRIAARIQSRRSFEAGGGLAGMMPAASSAASQEPKVSTTWLAVGRRPRPPGARQRQSDERGGRPWAMLHSSIASTIRSRRGWALPSAVARFAWSPSSPGIGAPEWQRRRTRCRSGVGDVARREGARPAGARAGARRFGLKRWRAKAPRVSDQAAGPCHR